MSRIPTTALLCFAGYLLAATGASARDALKEAAETAEAFVFGQQAKNEALLREISDPDRYEAMARDRSDHAGAVNENIRIDNVEITRIDGNRVTAKATYSKKHGKKKHQMEVHLIRVDGKWQVTTPQRSGGE